MHADCVRWMHSELAKRLSGFKDKAYRSYLDTAGQQGVLNG